MRCKSLTAAMACAALLVTAAPGHAQTKSVSMALKGGESNEVSDLYYVVACRSIMTAPPQATILSGPPEVTVEVKEASVTPRVQQCARPVKGAKLILKAGDVQDESETTMTVRVTYTTKDGPRSFSYKIDLSLFPAQ